MQSLSVVQYYICFPVLDIKEYWYLLLESLIKFGCFARNLRLKL